MRLTHVALLLATSGMLHAASDAPKRLDDSADMLTDIMSAPDKGIPQDLLQKAQCVVLVPGLKKGAFIVGAKYGKGFMLCRKPSGVGWSAPAAIRVEGGSVGFQIGGSETDVVMLVNSESGREETAGEQIHAGRGCIRRRGSRGAHFIGGNGRATARRDPHLVPLARRVRRGYRCKARRSVRMTIGTGISTLPRSPTNRS